MTYKWIRYLLNYSKFVERSNYIKGKAKPKAKLSLAEDDTRNLAAKEFWSRVDVFSKLFPVFLAYERKCQYYYLLNDPGARTFSSLPPGHNCAARREYTLYYKNLGAIANISNAVSKRLE